MVVNEIRLYMNRSGIDVVGNWLCSLEDLTARAKIAARKGREADERQGQHLA